MLCFRFNEAQRLGYGNVILMVYKNYNMNGFENIKERVELREKFKKETGDDWENSQGEPDIDYVLWLESKLFAIPDVIVSGCDHSWVRGRISDKTEVCTKCNTARLKQTEL